MQVRNIRLPNDLRKTLEPPLVPDLGLLSDSTSDYSAHVQNASQTYPQHFTGSTTSLSRPGTSPGRKQTISPQFNHCATHTAGCQPRQQQRKPFRTQPRLHTLQRRSLRRTYTLPGPILPDCYHSICNRHLLRTQKDFCTHQHFTTELNHPSITLSTHWAPPYYRNCLKNSQLEMFNPEVCLSQVRPNSSTTKLTTQSTKIPKCHLHTVQEETGR